MTWSHGGAAVAAAALVCAFGSAPALAQPLTHPRAGVLSALLNRAPIDDPRGPRDRAPWPRFTAGETADLMAFLQSLARPR